MTPSAKYSASQAPQTVACGQCIGCKMDRVRDWSIRCVHEAKLHDESCFITVSYDQENLPISGSLEPRELTLFLKRIRKQIEPQKVRYYACGEYGETTIRPHYHILLFGMWFRDSIEYGKSKSGALLYESQMLDALWGKGRCYVGRVTRESAAYVARYCLKKVSGPPAEQHYAGREPEFARMSRRPGLGCGWVQRYETDAFPSAFVVIDGKKHPVPRYYKQKLRDRYQFPTSDESSLLVRDDLYATRKTIRKLTGAAQYKNENTPERLIEKGEVAHYKQSKIGRK